MNWAFQKEQKEEVANHFHVFVGDLSSGADGWIDATRLTLRFHGAGANQQCVQRLFWASGALAWCCCAGVRPAGVETRRPVAHPACCPKCADALGLPYGCHAALPPSFSASNGP